MEHRDGKPLLIFDFDGVIAQSLPVVQEIASMLAPKCGFKSLSGGEIESMHFRDVGEILKSMCIPWYKVPFILGRIRKEYNGRLLDIPLTNGIQEVLQGLNGKGCTLGIVTSNSKNNAEQYLELHHLRGLFREVVPIRSLWGKHSVIKKMVKRNDASGRAVAYIGDEVRDIKAAKKAGIKSVAVSWGYNDIEVLKKYDPDHLAEAPKDLLEICNSLSVAHNS